MTRNRRDRRDRLKEFFEDSHGFYSMVRLGYFVNLILSAVISVYCTFLGKPGEATELVLALSGIGAFGKVAQKQIEERSNHDYPVEPN